jgi:hypothetical protein
MGENGRSDGGCLEEQSNEILEMECEKRVQQSGASLKKVWTGMEIEVNFFG